MLNPSTLTERQARFVQEYLVDGNGTQAAIRAGYGAAGARVAAHRAITNVAVQEALQARQKVDAARLALQREDVLAGLLEAAELAKLLSDPAGMVAAWKQVGLLMGYYSPQSVKVDVNVAGQAHMDRLDRLSDADLLKMIETGAAARMG